MKKTIHLEAIDPIEIYGAGNRILLEFCSYFPKLKVTARGHELILEGHEEDIASFSTKLEELIERRHHKMNLTPYDVDDIFDGETSPDRFRLDGVKAVWMDGGMYVVSSFTALDGATEELAEELLGEVEPVQENGEGYPSGLNLTDTIQETSGWPEITTWRMTSVNGIPETLFLTIPEAGGERTKIELKLKEE